MKKFLALFVSLLLTVTTVSVMGCGGTTIEDTETNIEIQYYQAGFGDQCFIDLAAAFEKKYESKGYTVSLVPDASLISANARSMVLAGPTVKTTDLYFVGDMNIRQLVEDGPSALDGYDCVLEDLSDLYAEEVEPGVTYAEKMDDFTRNYHNNNGKYYSTGWTSGSAGLCYRADFFERNNWEIPVTTNELAQLIDKIKAAGYVPFVWNGTPGYWSYVWISWWAQYAEEEGINDFLNGKDKYGDVSALIYRTPEFLEAYQALETCIYDKTNSYTGSISFDNGKQQNFFYNTDKKICMTPNGNWLATEMDPGGYGSIDVRMMKTPVLSSILKTANTDGIESDRFDTIKDEATLSKTIKAIDAGAKSCAGVSADDYARLTKIRSYRTTLSHLHQAVIPAYANAKEAAKEFLKFMATDEGMEIFYKTSKTFPPFDASNIKVDDSESNFAKDILNLGKDATYVGQKMSTNKLFYMTNLDIQMEAPELSIGQPVNGKYTGEEFMKKVYDDIERRWSTYSVYAQ